MLRAETILDLDKRFAEFADISSHFSRDLVRETPEFTRLSRSDNVALNLRIARTVFSKWSVDIVSLLYTNRTAGFQEIQKALGRITSRVLSNKLARMERMGLIKREVLPTKPPRVLYSLTEKGLRASRLGEPVFLYLRFTEGVLVQVPEEVMTRTSAKGALGTAEAKGG